MSRVAGREAMFDSSSPSSLSFVISCINPHFLTTKPNSLIILNNYKPDINVYAGLQMGCKLEVKPWSRSHV